jgi:hypothetical protein
MHFPGLPYPGSPLMDLPPQFLRRMSLRCPHPSGKGRGGRVRISEGGEAFELEPTSLKRGEGLISGCFRVVGGESGVVKSKVVVVGWVEDERISTVMGLI